MPMRVSYEVHGEVQGVNYRSFTTRKASSHGLTGWVTNTSDGTVKGEAQGEKDALQKFIQELGKGPSAASVTKVENSEIDEVKGEKSFDTK
ncbi:MAG: hypothetical protein M1812_002747 [Candelaria pacifica]|nr:MAG: hypothetical protein M1812_002747 [Candelaria pacifica]